MSSSTKITKYDLDDSVFEQVEQDIANLQQANENLGSDKQDKHSTVTVTLSVASWSNNSQTVTATGVTADNTIIISPSPTSHTAYGSAKVVCTAQTMNTLTFTCGEIPESDLTVNVVILGV